jgi:hypothetical protein
VVERRPHKPRVPSSILGRGTIPYTDSNKQRVAQRESYIRRTEFRRARQRERRKEMREWVASLKAGPCADCGNSYHPAAMDFDHLPGYGKVQQINRLLVTLNKELVLAEIAKCELVCANCHRVRTYKRSLEG